MASKMSWTPQEQEMLKQLKQERGISSWKKIANILNNSENEFNKTAKQYRDRYVNYIRFNENCPKIMQWSQKQQVAFLEKYFKYGAKWVQISLEMDGRSENNLKNKFYGLMRKVTRRVQNFEKKLKPKPKKFTNEKYIIRALDECRRSNERITVSLGQINNKLIKLLTEMNEETSDCCISELISILKKVNCSSQKNSLEQKSSSILQQSNCHSQGLTLGNKIFDETGAPNYQAQICSNEEQLLPDINEFTQICSDLESMQNLMEITDRNEQRFDLLDELWLGAKQSEFDGGVCLLW